MSQYTVRLEIDYSFLVCSIEKNIYIKMLEIYIPSYVITLEKRDGLLFECGKVNSHRKQ